jgi:cobalt-zinc-cadmium efflux system protein
VAAGVVIALTGQSVADPIVSLLIGGLILWSSWGILTEAVNVLLEAAPKGVDVRELEQAVRAIPGVRGVHDLHVWAVAPGLAACSLHILVAEQSALEGQRVQQAVSEKLERNFRIAHTTIQVEVEACEVNDTHCTMQSPGHSHDEHGHGHRGR